MTRAQLAVWVLALFLVFIAAAMVLVELLQGAPVRLGSLFTGYGGLEMAINAVMGSTTAWVSDIDKGACKIIDHRYPGIPNLGDITAVDWSAVEPVDVLTGGFPCQDLSHAGKRAGLRPDTRSGLWTHMAYAVDQLRPRLVIAENVRGLLSASATSDLEPCPWCLGGPEQSEPHLRALGAVLGDLADIGYDAQWFGLRAADVGAPHGRFRVFIVATDTRPEGWSRGANGNVRQAGRNPAGSGGIATDTRRLRRQQGRQPTPGETPRGESFALPRVGGGVDPAPDTTGNGRDERRTEPARIVGRPDAAERGSSAADAGSERHGRGEDGRPLGRVDGGPEGEARQRQRAWAVAGDRSPTSAADAALTERRGAESEHLGTSAGSAAESGECPSQTGCRPERMMGLPETPLVGGPSEAHGWCGKGHGYGCSAWGQYSPAIHRWEILLGRLAPAPTEVGPKGGARLSPRAVEFMMGLPVGWVTDVPGLSRNEQLKALGNGVVPQQAAAALRLMLDQLRAVA